MVITYLSMMPDHSTVYRKYWIGVTIYLGRRQIAL